MCLDLERTKQKSQRRKLDSARVVLERVKVCSSILVKGFSGKTTKDALCLYFENTKRSAGGPVEKVDLKSGDKHAVVHFADPKGKQLPLNHVTPWARSRVISNSILALNSHTCVKWQYHFVFIISSK